jgi:hypothetical protein
VGLILLKLIVCYFQLSTCNDSEMLTSFELEHVEVDQKSR